MLLEDFITRPWFWLYRMRRTNPVSSIFGKVPNYSSFSKIKWIFWVKHRLFFCEGMDWWLFLFQKKLLNWFLCGKQIVFTLLYLPVKVNAEDTFYRFKSYHKQSRGQKLLYTTKVPSESYSYKENLSKWQMVHILVHIPKPRKNWSST